MADRNFFMSIAALSPANGLDLLNRYSQSTGPAPATTAVDASSQVLKKALALAQLSGTEVLAGGPPDTGSQLDVNA